MVPLSRPLIAIYAAILVVYAPLCACGGEREESRRLEIAVTNSDEYAEAVLAQVPAKSIRGIGVNDHARIASILETTKEMVDTAKVLEMNDSTLHEGRAMMERANELFREVKDHIIQGQHEHENALQAMGGEEQRELLRHKYSEHDLQMVQEDEKRALDIARRIYETMITFPECVEKLLEDCLAIINTDLASLGLSTIEVVVHEKRNANQEGYNKVVIVTNELADRVKGRSGDGIVEYPFLWNDAVAGQRSLGVDGKWNCHEFSPEDCCNTIKQSVPTPDTRGKRIECHIFVPFGGVGNPRRNDRVFITLSPDGRVHEPPIIQ